MSTDADLKLKIRRWLEEEGVIVKEIEHRESDFRFVLNNAFGIGLIIDITKPKGKSFLVNGTEIKNSTEIQQKFSGLTEIEKFEFLELLKRDLLTQGIDFGLANGIEYITITHTLYIEDLSRTLFMDSVKSVRNATTFAISTLIEEFL